MIEALADRYRRYIKKVWVLENKQGQMATPAGPLVGDGRLEIIFVDGQGFYTTCGGEQNFFGAGVYLGGHIEERFALAVCPETKITFVKMEPWAACLLSGFDFQQANNQTVPLSEINPTLSAKLNGHGGAAGMGAALRVLAQTAEESAMAHRDFRLFYGACAVLDAQYIDFKAAKSHIIQHSGLSSRSIEQKFKRSVGLTPKKFANTVRLRKIAEDLQYSQQVDSLTMVALRHGYYDQAHFIRDCQRYLGLSPKAVAGKDCFLTHPGGGFRYYTI